MTIDNLDRIESGDYKAISDQKYNSYLYLSIIGIIIPLISLFFSYFTDLEKFYETYYVHLILSIIYLLFLLFHLHNKKSFMKSSLVYTYLFNSVFFMTVILYSVVFGEPISVLYYVSLATIPSFIIDRFQNVFIFTIFFASFNLILSYLVKSTEVFQKDLLNTFYITMISLVLTKSKIGVVERIIQTNKLLNFKASRCSFGILYSREDGIEKIKKMMKTSDGILLMIDINDFKIINDQHGHLFGDEVIYQLSHLFGNFHKSDEVIPIRFGGDEFIIYISNKASVMYAKELEEELRKEVSLLKFSNPEVKIELSIGYSLSNSTKDFDMIFNEADIMMYQKKGSK